MLKKNKELCIGVVFLVIGAVYLISAFFIPAYSGYGGQNISSSFLPKVLGVMMVVLSVMQLYASRKAARPPAEAAPRPEPGAEPADGVSVEEFDDDAATRGASTKSLLVIFLILIVYIAVMPLAGFILSTAFFMIASILVLTPENKRNIPLTLLLSAVVSVGVYFLFVSGLSLVLPAGILG